MSIHSFFSQPKTLRIKGKYCKQKLYPLALLLEYALFYLASTLIPGELAFFSEKFLIVLWRGSILNLVFLIIILLSLFTSTFISLLIVKKANKWLGIFIAFLVNTLILCLSTIFLYLFDIQTFHKQTDGLFGSLGILVLVFFIPILTFINYYFMELKSMMNFT